MVNIKGDGRWGFNDVCDLLGRSVDVHKIIRLNLTRELTSDRDHYLYLFGT